MDLQNCKNGLDLVNKFCESNDIHNTKILGSEKFKYCYNIDLNKSSKNRLTKLLERNVPKMIENKNNHDYKGRQLIQNRLRHKLAIMG